MVRVASIDLGSNSTRLLIADITNGDLNTIYKEHQVTRMADKLSETKIISKEAIKRVLKVLSGYFKTINKNNVENVQVPPPFVSIVFSGGWKRRRFPVHLYQRSSPFCDFGHAYHL